MSVVFKISAIQIPKSYDEEKIKSFFDTHTQLKSHEKPDSDEHYTTHYQSKRKRILDESFTVKCNDDKEVLLICSHVHNKNKFKLNKMKQRGDTNLAGRPKKVVECDKPHLEEITPAPA